MYYSIISLLRLSNLPSSCITLQNDIIGPAGYGDAHFIHPDLTLQYIIRFENDANATAPAQRVFIQYQLDDDLDPRTFRVGSLGFGDFIREISFSRAFVQVYIIWLFNSYMCHLWIQLEL